MESEGVEIILIEDNPHEAELAIRNLKKYHLANNLIHLDDGEEALNYIFSRGKYANRATPLNPKLILLDLQLPKVSGQEILKAIRENDQMQSIPIIVLTSSSDEADIKESYKLGATRYMVKPVNFEALSKCIAQLGMYWMVMAKNPSTLTNI